VRVLEECGGRKQKKGEMIGRKEKNLEVTSILRVRHTREELFVDDRRNALKGL